MRELFWGLGWLEPVPQRNEPTRAKANGASTVEKQESATSDVPEPSAWIAALEAHAALGHGALPAKFLVRKGGTSAE